jgi:pilus assembly protein CpaD
MKKNILCGLSVCLALALGACNPPAPLWKAGDSQPKPLKVDYVRLTHAAVFSPKAARLSGEESEKLSAFLENAQVTADDHVYIESPGGDHLVSQRIGQLAHQLSERGIGARTLPAKTSLPSDQLTVIVERYVVTPPNCPDWSKDPVTNHDNEPSSNFGCATSTNLGLMVADPRDLVIGRPMGPEEGPPAIAAVQRYRAGKVKPLQSGGGFTPGATPTGTAGGGDAGAGATGQ